MNDWTLWSADGLVVWVSWGTNGELVFQGQHVSSNGEYEYAVSVPHEDVPTVVAALGGTAGADVMALIKANGESIVRRGEKTWIQSLGITPTFWSRHGD